MTLMVLQERWSEYEYHCSRCWFAKTMQNKHQEHLGLVLT